MKKPGWIRVFLIVACTSIFLQSSGAFCADLGEKESSVKLPSHPLILRRRRHILVWTR